MTSWLQIQEIIFREVVANVEVHAGSLIYAEKSLLADVVEEPENLFDQVVDIAKSTENGEYIRKYVQTF